MRASRAAPTRERGVALLATLLSVALLTVIVIEMTDATLVHTHLTRNAGNAMAAQLLARSAETAGEALVTNDATNDPDVTCPRDDEWALPIVGLPVGPGTVALEIADESGKLDLNAVGTERHRAAVAALFETLGLEPALVDRVAAWIRPATSDPMATDQASDYCALPMPCEPRQGALNSLEELLLIEGFDESMLGRLRPFVTVITRDNTRSAGTPQPVNVNTARDEVLVALGCQTGAAESLPACSSNMTDEELSTWKADVEAWKTESCAEAPRNVLGTKSNLFSIRAVGTVGDVSQTLRVLVQRRGGRAQRLWWQERPVVDVLPVEVG
jgi:general secretion pathway protein K